MIRHELIELAEDCAERRGRHSQRLTEMAKLRCEASNTWTRWVIKVAIGKEVQTRFELVELEARGGGVDDKSVFGIHDDEAKRVMLVGSGCGELVCRVLCTRIAQRIKTQLSAGAPTRVRRMGRLAVEDTGHDPIFVHTKPRSTGYSVTAAPNPGVCAKRNRRIGRSG
jgi:hypothetical protein